MAAQIRKKLTALVGVLVVAIGVAVLLASMQTWPAKAGGEGQKTEEYCLSCHSNPDLTKTLPSGEVLSLYVDPEMLRSSLHSPAGIECEACHTQITTFPHPEISYQSRRELARSYYLACQKCHSDQYARTQDSIHARVAEGGNLQAPICTDCHGAHNVQAVERARTWISTTCSHCHTQIYAEYKDSVHGSALIEEDNPDVPVCTTCHGVHNIQDPRTAQFRVAEPDLCASCHANAELMAKYGLSADVYALYSTSWHGVDVTVYKANWPTIWHESAVCSDCHGIHNIRPTDDPASSVNPQNLLATCQKCHPQAGPNWTGAWTGHNRISYERTPILYYVKAFYDSFVPLVLWGCILYVVLQILRSSIERVRRSLP